MTQERLTEIRKLIAAGRKARKGEPVTDAEKRKAVAEYRKGGNAVEIAASLGVYRKSLYRWSEDPAFGGSARKPAKKAARKVATKSARKVARKRANGR
jgi:transposase-like protein